MQLTQKTQVDIDISNIEASINTFTNAINAAIITLNNTYHTLWNLPDERLTNVLQKLHDNNELFQLFTKHNTSASSLNQIKQLSNSGGVRAIDVAGREFEIVDGVVSLIVSNQEILE